MFRNGRAGAVVVVRDMRLGDGDGVYDAGSEEDGGECKTHFEV